MNSRKKNLLVIPSLFPRNKTDITGIFTWDYIESVKAHCQVTVFHMKVFGVPGLHKSIENEVEVYRYALLSSNSFLKPITALLYFVLIIKSKRIVLKHCSPNLVHAHGLAICGLLAVLVGNQLKIPVLVTEHSPVKKLGKSNVLMLLAKYVIKRINCFLTVSNDLAVQFKDASLIPKKSVVTFNPVNTTFFVPSQTELNTSLKNIIFVSRLVHYKRCDKVVESFLRIFNDHPDWTLTIIGSGPEDEAINKLKINGGIGGSAIRLLGKRTKEEIAKEMQQASFLIHPSEHETFGIVIAEAMSCGLPVIASKYTAPKEYVTEDCGILIDPFSDAEIENSMRKLITSYKNYDSKKIRNKVVENFGFESFGNKLNALYESELKSN